MQKQKIYLKNILAFMFYIYCITNISAQTTTPYKPKYRAYLGVHAGLNQTWFADETSKKFLMLGPCLIWTDTQFSLRPFAFNMLALEYDVAQKYQSVKYSVKGNIFLNTHYGFLYKAKVGLGVDYNVYYKDWVYLGETIKPCIYIYMVFFNMVIVYLYHNQIL